MARDTPVQNDAASTDAEPLPNLVTIVGRGVPSSFEITVDGEIEMDAADPVEEATIVSGSVAEGTIDVGVQRFRFDGQVTNVHVVDWNGNAVPESSSVPDVHVDYGVPQR
ncbi:hypothetical protein Htur_5254 (plasmid) [Haloterrigena turkmenica DSM 5511]|uniref:Uncharacterized protein n=1 Tax=Haloterrigena turkmenica (strain ATCC 51198 / DSM 5511 / JCM 9101 / NCIMB 13204 / VKM B-1734 / 4k) TaxID=543526 RepID=D2S3D8_HALTV|nr:hypothetical protein [Haloterrigena turkmenica]ADB63885.1 hypothetical protein Htur_5254 [Haloterrigena turkmenica DSM 5511]